MSAYSDFPVELHSSAARLGMVLKASAYIAAVEAAELAIKGGIAYEGLKYGIELISRSPHEPLSLIGGVALTYLGAGIVKNTVFQTAPRNFKTAKSVLEDATEGRLYKIKHVRKDLADKRDQYDIDKLKGEMGSTKHMLWFRNNGWYL